MIKKIYSNIDVVQMAKIRIKNVFDSTNNVYLSVSGGKDSIVLNDIVYKMVISGEVDKNKLTVQFIDEEAIYPCVEQIVKNIRKQWMLIGVKFEWYCIECKHFNCFNSLSQDESFICWDRYKKDKWIREMPPYAITYPPDLIPRVDTYQSFAEKNNRYGLTLTGVRCAESVQRMNNIARTLTSTKSENKKVTPIYDMMDDDIWKYIYDNNLDIPKAYIYLYQVGNNKRDMRISQFFSIDTMKSLVQMCEFYPNLFDKITKREPNAYMAMLYYDTELFRRKKSKTKEDKEKEKSTDWKKKTLDLLSNEDFFTTDSARRNRKDIQHMILKYDFAMDNKNYKDLYNCLVAGDPKNRTKRAITLRIIRDHSNRLIEEGAMKD